MSKKNSFVLYADQFECFSLLSMESRGRLITAIFEHHINGETSITLSDSERMAFHLISSQMKRDAEKYQQRCENNRDNINKRWASRNQTTSNRIQTYTTVYDRIQTDTKHTDNDNVNVTDNNITTITTITPPTPSSEGKEGKRKIKVSEIDSADKNFDLDTYLGSDEHDLFVAVCDRMREQCVRETSVMNEATAFIAYNEARDWKGLGGEDVIANLTKYVARWVREKAKKEDAG